MCIRDREMNEDIYDKAKEGGMMTVSYTHLPVCPCAGIYMLEQSGYIPYVLSVHRPVIHRAYRLDAVSYTHLDVYKRQGEEYALEDKNKYKYRS